MYNSSCNGIFDLIRFSGTFCLTGRNIFFYIAYMPPDLTALPQVISPPKTPYEVIEAQGFNVEFYGIVR